MLAYIIIAAAAYFLGSIPTGYLFARTKRIDIRAVGSGNIGATNAMRVLGKPAGIAVLLLDAFKGYAACAFLTPLVYNRFAPHLSGLIVYFHDEPMELQTRFYLLAGIFAVLGHNYTCWLKFKGGKGIATTGGVYLALAPVAVVVALLAFLLMLWLTRYVSVGSIAAAVMLPAATWALAPRNVLLGGVTTALGLMAIYKHRSNIKRLRAGTENRLGRKPEIQEGAK